MAFGDDLDIGKLLEQFKGLFRARNTSTVSGNSNILAAPTSYQAPIKGSWKSSGGFDPVSIRPNGRKGHMGVDMRAPGGTPIYPLTDGVISNVGSDPLGGNVISIQHPGGIRSYYAHLSTVKVFKGDKVDKNTIIGAVGDTGNAKGTFPHLHFQVWQDNQIQDPAKYFGVPAYSQVSQKEQVYGQWISEQAKQQAAQFNMKGHIRHQKAAFSAEVARVVRAAEQFYKLVSD